MTAVQLYRKMTAYFLKGNDSGICRKEKLVMFCTECGKEISGNAKFCPYCGARIEIEPMTQRARNDPGSGQPQRGTRNDPGTGQPQYVAHDDAEFFQPTQKPAQKKKNGHLPVILAAVAAAAVAVILVIAGIGRSRTGMQGDQGEAAATPSGAAVSADEQAADSSPSGDASEYGLQDFLYTHAWKQANRFRDRFEAFEDVFESSSDDDLEALLNYEEYGKEPEAVYSLDFSGIPEVAREMYPDEAAELSDDEIITSVAAGNIPARILLRNILSDSGLRQNGYYLFGADEGIYCEDLTETEALLFIYENAPPIYTVFTTGTDGAAEAHSVVIPGATGLSDFSEVLSDSYGAGSSSENTASDGNVSQDISGLNLAEIVKMEPVAGLRIMDEADIPKADPAERTADEIAAKLAKRVISEALTESRLQPYKDVLGEEAVAEIAAAASTAGNTDPTVIYVFGTENTDELLEDELFSESDADFIHKVEETDFKELYLYNRLLNDLTEGKYSSVSDVYPGTLASGSSGTNEPAICLLDYGGDIPPVVALLIPESDSGVILAVAGACFNMEARELYETCLMLGACNRDPDPSWEQKTAVSVQFEHKYEDFGEYGIITGYDEDGNVLWTVMTGNYEATQLIRVGEIGMANGMYYYYEDQRVVTLNLSDGSRIWENTDAATGSASSVFDTDGTLYIVGGEEVTLTAIDADGNTLHKLERADGYMWPYGLEITGDEIRIGVTTSDVNLTETYIYVNKNDFSWSPVSGGTESAQEDSDESGAGDSETGQTATALPEVPYLIFTSGVGGWGTGLTLNSDGTFSGSYSDEDMGFTGDGYPNGTIYACDFSGYFTDIEKVSDYVYTMRLGGYTTAKEVGTEEILDGVKYIYSDPYGIEGGDVFTLILPGGDVSAEGEAVLSWLVNYDLSECYVLVNEAQQQAFGSYS